MLVYFIQSGKKGAIKIGRTKNLAKRLERLQCGNPFELRVLATIPCGSEEECIGLEARLHRFFRKSRIRGEWFKGTIRFTDYHHPRIEAQ